MGTGKPQASGNFRFWYDEQRWEWSDEVAAIHGYPAGSTTPSTELLLSHKHPDDRDYVADAIAKSAANHEPFCSRHRIIDATGTLRHVIVLGDTMTDENGTAIGSIGYFIDLTDSFDQQRQETLDTALPELFEVRAVIEQAKGVLMRIYRINSDQAFRVLQWRSQETNVKLRSLATQLIAELNDLPPCPPQEQTAFDHLLLTLHERIPAR
ncbi:PAS and ANTAR domain-containing protein [Nocardia sp. CA-128927]|uniref:PAS and ANTAR domain-containing protein n=1 Tax=Nocardia sp. CA-128927 TaxID=3239975 RepID=UPI003D9A0B64